MARLIIMGPAGSGKGTQGKVISQKYGIPVISTGNLLREKASVGDELGKQINELISQGMIVPIDIITKILYDRLVEADCNNGFILDGFPRTVEQAIDLEKFLNTQNVTIDGVLVLNISRDEVIKRTSGRFECKKCKTMYNKFYKNTKIEGVCDVCGSTEFFVRNDDSNVDAINKRLDIYEEMSNKIIEYYDKKNLIYNVDAVKSIEDISQDIDNIIINYINK
ncbi:MAG: adenylate kinase [Rickettsiales bacterium]|nr:adenylate kinase [Rickettsiales bacterium]